ncbi:MAG: thiamine pyrophosphate-binding protein [Chromatiales bacterium]
MTTTPEKVSALKISLREARHRQGALNGHDLIARSLRELGVTHVFGISGTPVYETHAACAKAGMRVIGVRHQQAAAMMAAAQNYACGRMVAAVILSAGPAVTNAATGILVAHDNGWPLLVLGGRRPLHMQHLGSFQQLDAIPIFRPITKCACLIEGAAEIPEMLARAFRIAVSGRPGPVYLDVPEEALQKTAIVGQPASSQPKSQTIESALLDHAADILLIAERPALIIGDGLRWSAPFAELGQLVAQLKAPFVTSPMARGFLPDDHPLCHNAARSTVLSTADAIVIAGARLDWTFRYGAEIARDAKMILVGTEECEFGVNVASAVGIAGDAKLILSELLVRLARGEPQAIRNAGWREHLAAKRQETIAKWQAPAQTDVFPMSPQRLILEIRDAIPREAIRVVDGNIIMETAQQLLPSYSPVSRFSPGHNGCMGIGIPFGIGAQLAFPERPVVVISGDFAFGLSAMEMETAVRLRLPVIVIVANNDGNAGLLLQKRFYPEDYPDRVTAFQPGIRYEQIMRAFGGHAESVERPADLRPAFERAIACGVPACINVRVNSQSPFPQ